jgi:two-component system response regulator CpxR
MRILVVDDEAELGSSLQCFFEQCGFVVDYECDPRRAVARNCRLSYDLLILDIGFPHQDGFETLRQIRAGSQVPVIMLTGRADPAARIRAFELGADDYLTKPFLIDELAGRVKAICRRTSATPSGAPRDLRVGDLHLVPSASEAFYQGRNLDLTAMECAVLEQLMKCCGRVVSRDQLSEQLFQRPLSPFDRSVDTHVSRIRRKIRAPRNLIRSVRGTGYQLCDPGDVENAAEQTSTSRDQNC